VAAAFALLVLTLRLMVPLMAHVFMGLGIAVPRVFTLLPPQIGVPLFFLGIPLLFLAACWAIWDLARHR
jgi:hypothetical protein